MQENRSFDHYFGAMPGVRGFADPAAIRLPGGRPVFCQPDPSHREGYLLPFHFDTKTTSAQATPGTDHIWPSQHQAWNGGKMDAWIAAKGEYTMGYFGRADIPFHWALAEAFTICDNYYCSVFGPTNPNRLYMWTGMIDPAGTGGGPVIDDTPAFNNVILSWTTYPERLQRAGISWQVYQEEDNFDDNALAWFTQYAHLPASSPLYQRGIAARPAGTFEQDARYDRLPQVSWLIAPTAQSEHPDYFPAAGAEYIAQKLDAIASNPVLWAKTAFILCYDENDGMFDHVPPPIPPAGTAAEFVRRTSDRPGVPRPRDRGLTVDRRRLRQFRRVRSHVADPSHRGAVRCPRAQHQLLAAPDLRGPHIRLPVLRPADPLPAGQRQPAGRGHGSLAGQRTAGGEPEPSTGHPAGQSAAPPPVRLPLRASPTPTPAASPPARTRLQRGSPIPPTAAGRSRRSPSPPPPPIRKSSATSSARPRSGCLRVRPGGTVLLALVYLPGWLSDAGGDD